MKKAVLLDRDGVINEKAPEGDYVTRWEDFRFLAGASNGIALLKQAGFLVIVVSNQRCIARGLVSAQEVEELHERMWAELSARGAYIDAIYYCPHDYADSCSCRKPHPGMLLQAAKDHDLDLSSSWMIGDTRSDMEAATRAGCHTALITQGDQSGIEAELWAASLLEAARKIVGTLHSSESSTSAKVR